MKKIFTLIAAVMLAVGVQAQRIIFETGQNPMNGFENGDFKISVVDEGSKLVIDANNAYFGTAEEQEKFSTRLKSGGKSTSKLFLTANVPSAGTLKIYVRTGSNSATDRNLKISQTTELYNSVVKESDAVKVKGLDEADLEKETNVYPVISVEVVKGDVKIEFPVGSLNFYCFEFIAGEDVPEPVLDPTEAKAWDFVNVSETDLTALAENTNWNYDESIERYSYGTEVANGAFVDLGEIGFAPGAGIAVGRNGGKLAENAIRIDVHKRLQLNGSNCVFKIKSLVKDDVVLIHYANASVEEERSFTVENGDVTTLEAPISYDEIAEKNVAVEQVAQIVVAANGDLTLTQTKAINVFSIAVNMDDVPTGIESVAVRNETQNKALYNLAGQKVSDDFKGLAIKNGKIVVLK